MFPTLQANAKTVSEDNVFFFFKHIPKDPRKRGNEQNI